MTMIACDSDADADIASAARIGVSYLGEANGLLREANALQNIPQNAPSRESDRTHLLQVH